MSAVKDGLEKAWAEFLAEEAGFPFFPHRHDGFTAPPFGVVLVKRLQPTVPGDNVHLADVRIVVVTDAADTSSPEHRRLTGAAYTAVENTPRKATDVANGVRLCGFMVTDIEPASGTGDDGKSIHSDVFMIQAGCAGLTPGVVEPEIIPDFSAEFLAALNS